MLFAAAPESTAQLRHVITGVAMATTSDHLQLYFGCTAQTPIIGGAGLVRMRTPADNFRFRSSEVVPVRTAAAESPLFAGSMFVIERRAQSNNAIQSSPSRVLPSMLCALSVLYLIPTNTAKWGRTNFRIRIGLPKSITDSYGIQKYADCYWESAIIRLPFWGHLW